ncbi:hypothetical protein GCK72_017380 [Caenorhabditis remanei]|uniref:Uncharacterized protein n=1 Tax=Caenorhabditis remanei TaxID=31234 RepID=A0A6A5G8I8_CAERE|nr:hypothetical protein GCK72_017380 [Caenorhabditis remanei]KAF1750829.1 hypothetical protein GCK72_017380 [Caenorhabditis remanei]
MVFERSVLLSFDWAIDSNHDSVVSLVWFQCDLLEWLELLLLQLVDFSGEDGLWLGCAVNAVSFDGDDGMSTVFKEVLCVEGNNTSLIWLSDIREDDIDHS